MDKYALIGKPLGHTFSPGFFNQKFREEHINAVYEAHELDSVELFPDWVASEPLLKGINVTIPYKTTVMPYLERVDSVATAVGAVNCICREAEGWVGYNTDVIGFERMLVPLLHTGINNALVLGTGGSSKAVQYVLRKLGITAAVVSRAPNGNELGYSALNREMMQSHLLIVNTTPVGMFPNVEECPDVPYTYLTPQHVLVDLIYNPAETLFLKLGKEQGATISNGYPMLVHQALAGWELWNRH
ncbi:MAG: shikimate dehydrogenase [Chitinophagia bacterium]|nr:shikimate dehydrogenase [Chitinophagia bacterium]